MIINNFRKEQRPAGESVYSSEEKNETYINRFKRILINIMENGTHER